MTKDELLAGCAFIDMKARAEKAEAEVKRLRKALRYYAGDDKLGDVARRVLRTTSAPPVQKDAASSSAGQGGKLDREGT